ncbi:MAG: acyclic terpene utilization AtuA family protein [Pirellulaceae bacterium]|nr:acyclic terpene utilization AtuA family protein [Pirellulaceae bacterium]
MPETRGVKRDLVRIANGQGFWGDSLLGPVRLVNEGPLDYLTLDYLAEVTMSIMQKLKSRDPSAGYATDFVQMVRRVLPQCQARGIKIIANAGGVNPQACLEAVAAVVRQLGLHGVRIAMIEGDDILSRLPAIIAAGHPLKNMDSGESLAAYVSRATSANVYIGAASIVEALEGGADIVIAGRATDPSLVVAPMVYEFGWSWDDFDRLAAATVAGHIIECGAQCTGGNFTHWQEVPDLARIGYPIVEAEPSGRFVVTKHDGTGGLVNRQTVTSQLIYEMGDPARYLTPDCIADFSSIQLQDAGPNRVEVSGVRGLPATDTYKVSISFQDGYKLVGQLTIAGPDAIAKAQACADIVFARAAMDGVAIPAEDRMVEMVGTGVCHQGIWPSVADPSEVVLRIGARGKDRAALDRLGMEIIPLVTSGPPGVTGFAGGRPKASEIISYWPALLDKHLIQTKVTIEEVR